MQLLCTTYIAQWQCASPRPAPPPRVFRWLNQNSLCSGVPGFPKAASLRTASPGEQRCFLAERPGRSVGLWHGGQPIGCPGMVSFLCQPLTRTQTEHVLDGFFDCAPWKRTLCTRVTVCTITSRSGGYGRAGVKVIGMALWTQRFLCELSFFYIFWICYILWHPTVFLF